MADEPENGDLDALLQYLHERRNFDFRGYKRASLTRRIRKRMQALGIDDYQRYTEVLEGNPGEFAELFNTILINVTGLARDWDAWDTLAETIIPAIIDTKPPEEPARIWSAGCASGEEAYTLAVLFAEALGEERFRRSVKIYATDADSDALIDARHGRYREKDLIAAFGEERTNRFFERDGDMGVFRQVTRSIREIGGSCTRSCRPKISARRRSPRNTPMSPSRSKNRLVRSSPNAAIRSFSR